MDVSDIREIVVAFGQAARRCKDGGLDGVKIVSVWNQLIDQFWSTLSNQRIDRLYFGKPISDHRKGTRVARGADACHKPPTGTQAQLGSAR